MSNLRVSLKAHKKRETPGATPCRGRCYRQRNALSALLLGGMLVSAVLLLPPQAVAEKTASATLTLKTRVTAATCNLTRNGIIPAGIQVVPLPGVTPGEVTRAGEMDWHGHIVPLNLGLRCSVLPEPDVYMSLVITPAQTDADYTRAMAIASVKSDGSAGPDLLIVNTDRNNIPVPSNSMLSTDIGKCDNAEWRCVNMNATGTGPSEWRLPLGVRVFIPDGAGRAGMLTPGTWHADVTLNIAYQ
ncbi:type 1 fimbrial protein [Morganella morganii]|nr:type 1 fimbrial protein [Morganella morganii]